MSRSTMGSHRRAGFVKALGGRQSSCGSQTSWVLHAKRLRLSLPARNEWGESRREGQLIKNRLLSPTLSSFLRRRGRENAVADPRAFGCGFAALRCVEVEWTCPDTAKASGRAEVQLG